jgi:hypothetical protein
MSQANDALRDGKVVRQDEYSERADTIKAAARRV